MRNIINHFSWLLAAIAVVCGLYADGPLPSSNFRQPVTVTAGNVATNKPPLDVTATWTVSTNTYTGLRYNVTDSASTAGSLLMDLQVGGTSRFKVDKSGVPTGGGFNFTGNNPTITATGTLLFNGDFSLGARAGGLFVVKDTGAYSWSSSTAFNATPDTYAYRDAAGVVNFRNGANAQSVRVSNGYTDGSNYDFGEFGWKQNANQLTLGTYNGGTFSTARSVVIDSASSVTLRSRANGAVIDSNSGLILFQRNGTSVWQITTAGTLGPQTDGGQDIGNSGGQRPANIYMTGNLVMGGASSQIQVSKTITAAGTVGAQTINKASGSVNLAAGATSLVVTDSLVTTSSVILLTVAANDATCKSVAYVPGSGSFTIYPNAAPTAETRVNFYIATP